MPDNTTTRTILVVEDSEDIRFLLLQVLEEEGYRVILAGDGLTALRLADAHHPHLILMDLSLPGMNGWDAVLRLRELHQFDRTPIVAVTAHATKEDEARSLAIGCNVHISKPFDIDGLLEHIARLLA